MNKGGKAKDVFEVERIREIIQLMEQHGLMEIDLQQGDEKIKLNRGSVAPHSVAPQMGHPAMYVQPPVMQPPVPGLAAAAPAAATPPPAEPAPSHEGTITINAPMVGTFYARPNPESDSFVKVGDTINEDTIVCIIEAMKVFSEIPAECSGKIVEVLMSDQEAVDYGKPMFRVLPSGS